jgi:hypothetical protein
MNRSIKKLLFFPHSLYILTLTHKYSLSLTHTFTHTHTLYDPHSHSLSYTHALTHTHNLTCTHSYTHSIFRTITKVSERAIAIEPPQRCRHIRVGVVVGKFFKANFFPFLTNASVECANVSTL